MNAKLKPKLSIPVQRPKPAPNQAPAVGSSRSTVSSSFQQRMQVKKLMAARESGDGYEKGSLMERKFNRKISNLAADSYGTHVDRLQESLQRQSDLAADNDPEFSYARNVRDRIQGQMTGAGANGSIGGGASNNSSNGNHYNNSLAEKVNRKI